jgi:hypothetical protein
MATEGEFHRDLFLRIATKEKTHHRLQSPGQGLNA